MATSNIDPRILELLDQLGRQAKKGASPEGDSSSGTPFGMSGGPGLDLLRTLYAGPTTTNFIGTPPVVSGPEKRASGVEEATTPSRAPRLPDLSPARQLALGAMPNSSIEPQTVQRALGIDIPNAPTETIDYGKTPRAQAADTGDETAQPRMGGFQEQRLAPTPSLINSFPEMQSARIPEMMGGGFPEIQAGRIPEMTGGGFQQTPVIQGAPKMPEMGFPSAQGALAQAPTAALAGLMAQQNVPLLPAGGMPGMPSMAAPDFSGLGGGSSGGGGGGGGAGTGLRGIGTGTGTAGHPLAATIASLLPGLLKSLPLDTIKNLLGGGLGNLGPAGTVEGDPLGTGALTNTAPDILRPVDNSTYFAGDPEAGLGSFDNYLPYEPSTWDFTPSDYTSSIEPSTWISDAVDNFDWGDFF